MPSIKFCNLSRTKMECFFLSPASEVVEKLTSIKHSVMHYVRNASSSYVSHPLVLHASSAPLHYLSRARHIEAPKKSTAAWHSNAREVVVVVNVYQAYWRRPRLDLDVRGGGDGRCIQTRGRWVMVNVWKVEGRWDSNTNDVVVRVNEASTSDSHLNARKPGELKWHQ